ncbi:clathrin light chain [Eurytemora carolleeae]|uniref:clathrin light chain n=1 Tax=Eurytemora carolleeae TaxID=1294199 RepID=UPI000C7617CF|nr:clathrin light chain [Eurytemora carolleeae]|eukprot:XP_023339931.1 clathrin light chain-like [Eurytemora affinis]
MSGFEDDFGEMVESKDEDLLQGEVEVEEDPAAEFLSREQQQLGEIDQELGAAFSTSTIAVYGSRPASTEQAETVSPVQSKPVKQEPAVLREWREQQMIRLKTKDEEEENDREELKQQAAKELEDWYKVHQETLEKTRAANREARLSIDRSYISTIETLEPGTEWERVSTLCDFNQKTSKNIKDVSRMRSIILQLKQNSPATAAATTATA